MKTHEAWTVRRAGGLVALSMASLLLLGGCKKQPENNTASMPAGQAPTAPASATPAPAPPQPMTAAPQQPSTAAVPAPPPPPPAQVYTVPRGTRVAVRVSRTISEKSSNVGDNFRGALARSIRIEGVPVLRAGTPVVGTVVAVRRQGRFKGAGDLAIALNSIGSQTVTTTSYEKTVSSKGKRSAGFIGGGGGGGALIGALAGGGKGALIGGLIGAGAGTAGAAYTGNANVSIPAESVVSFSLTSPLNIVLKPATADQPQQ